MQAYGMTFMRHCCGKSLDKKVKKSEGDVRVNSSMLRTIRKQKRTARQNSRSEIARQM